MEAPVFLSLGSNLGNQENNLSTAVGEIAIRCGKVVAASSLYKTAAWGKTDQPDFLNQVVAIETALVPAKLLTAILEIEKNMGRIRTELWGERIIDIDILFYNKHVVDVEGLIIPHSALTQRRFVLAPLNELAPDFVHPVLNKKVHQLLEACEDKLLVVKIN